MLLCVAMYTACCVCRVLCVRPLQMNLKAVVSADCRKHKFKTKVLNRGSTGCCMCRVQCGQERFPALPCICLQSVGACCRRTAQMPRIHMHPAHVPDVIKCCRAHATRSFKRRAASLPPNQSTQKLHGCNPSRAFLCSTTGTLVQPSNRRPLHPQCWAADAYVQRRTAVLGLAPGASAAAH